MFADLAVPDHTSHIDLPHDLAAYAQLHHGLIDYRAAHRLGIGRCTWRAWHRDGSVIRLHHNVAALPNFPSTQEQRIAAAVISVRGGATASHRSAAFMWGLRNEADEPVDLTLRRTGTPAPREGVVLHRPRDRADLMSSRRLGIACTNPLRTMLDLGAVDPDAVADTLGRLVISGIATRAAIVAALNRHSVIGRDGLGPLRNAIRDWPLADHHPDSQLEVDAARLLRQHGLDRYDFHARLHGFEVDFAYPAERVVLETDGWEFHQSREAFEEDRRRDVCLAANGWLVVRVTWRQIQEKPEWVTGRLRQILASR